MQQTAGGRCPDFFFFFLDVFFINADEIIIIKGPFIAYSWMDFKKKKKNAVKH